MKENPENKYAMLAVFSVAMGFMESTVVVYLRAHWYPGGFAFPLVMLDGMTLTTELARETATLVMLVTVAMLAAHTRAGRLAAFMFCFGIWDLAYYLFLKLLIDWPATWFDWDILFLIPVPWTGPVAAPCLLAALMIAFAVRLTRAEKIRGPVALARSLWLLAPGCLAVVASFCKDYLEIELTGSGFASYIPDQFSWWLFFTGVAFILAGMWLAGNSRYSLKAGPLPGIHPRHE